MRLLQTQDHPQPCAGDILQIRRVQRDGGDALFCQLRQQFLLDRGCIVGVDPAVQLNGNLFHDDAPFPMSKVGVSQLDFIQQTDPVSLENQLHLQQSLVGRLGHDAEQDIEHHGVH